MEGFCIAYVAAFFESENGIDRTLRETAGQAQRYVASICEAGRLGYLYGACIGGEFGKFIEQEVK